METRQAYFRNMRSKCRCSCVLQFTRHHRVSSVLHRPPSQMIHCIVLYLDSQTWSSSDSAASHRFNKKTASHPFKGEIENLTGGESSLNCSPKAMPSWSKAASKGPPVSGSTGYSTSASGRPGTSNRQTIGRPAQDVAGRGRQAPTARTGRGYPAESRGFNQFIRREVRLTDNDPSAGSPTETLLRLLLPLNATVWSSSRQPGRVIREANSPRTSLKRSIGSSDGRCVQRAGT